MECLCPCSLSCPKDRKVVDLDDDCTLFPGLCLSFVTCSNKRRFVFIQEIKAGINEAYYKANNSLPKYQAQISVPIDTGIQSKGLELLGCWMVKGKSA